MFATIAGWYARADRETIELMKRFGALVASKEKPNEYIKQILRRELDNVVETPDLKTQ